MGLLDSMKVGEFRVSLRPLAALKQVLRLKKQKSSQQDCLSVYGYTILYRGLLLSSSCSTYINCRLRIVSSAIYMTIIPQQPHHLAYYKYNNTGQLGSNTVIVQRTANCRNQSAERQYCFYFKQLFISSRNYLFSFVTEPHFTLLIITKHLAVVIVIDQGRVIIARPCDQILPTVLYINLSSMYFLLFLIVILPVTYSFIEVDRCSY